MQNKKKISISPIKYLEFRESAGLGKTTQLVSVEPSLTEGSFGFILGALLWCVAPKLITTASLQGWQHRGWTPNDICILYIEDPWHEVCMHKNTSVFLFKSFSLKG